MLGVPFPIRRVATVLAFSSQVLASNVLVVAPSGTTYSNIQAAVDAAVDGDVVLVRPSASRYPAFTIGDKSVFVVGDTLAPVAVWGPVLISGLSSGRVTGLVNLDVLGVSNANPSVSVESCSGVVRLEGCTFIGYGGTPGGLGGSHGLRLTASTAVLLSGGGAGGGFGSEGDLFVGPLPTTGGVGLRAEASSCAAWQAWCGGGSGENAYLFYDAGSGGAGIRAESGTLFLSGVSAWGGHGGYPNCCGYAGSGGAGILASSLLRLLGGNLNGGLGGPGSGGCGPCTGMYFPPGGAGLALFNSGTTETLPSQPKRMSGTRVVREGGTIQLDFQGNPGDIVGLILSDAPDHQYVASQLGVQACATTASVSHRIVRMGTIDASGHLVRNLSQPDLGPGVGARLRYLQPIVAIPGGALRLGTPATLIALDSAY